MEAVIAGWLAGYVMSVGTTIALMYLLTRGRAAGLLERWASSDVRPVLFAVPASLGATLAWTMMGLVLGSLYEVSDAHAARGGLGSPSLPFTIGMLGVAWLPVPILIAFARSTWWLWVSMALLFAVLFGWVMPHLAGR